MKILLFNSVRIILFAIILFLFHSCSDKVPAEEVISAKEYTREQFNSFIFIGAAKNLPSLYIYSPHKQYINEIWKPGREKIIELSYSPDRNSGFFITASKIGTKGVFPFITGIKLYVINNDSVITFVNDIGNALQVYAKWETNNAFRIFINRMDPENPSLITQTVQIYNTYGKLFEEEQLLFDLLTDGYPNPESDDPELSSSGNEYSFLLKKGNPDSLFFIYRNSEKKVYVHSTSKLLKKILYSPDLLFAVVEFTGGLSEKDPGSSDILLYSIQDKKVIEDWRENTPGTLFIKNNLLLFDKGRKNKSSILIYDLDKRRINENITMKEGCSLRTILN